MNERCTDGGAAGPLSPTPSPSIRAYVPRYPTRKFKAFADYQDNASVWRVWGVIFIAPLLPLMSTLLAPLVPLRNPHEGYLSNWPGYQVHVSITMWWTTVAACTSVRASAGISHSDYPTVHLVVIALLVTAQVVGIELLLSQYWRFPVPFIFALVSGPWLVVFSWTHYVVLYTRFRRSDRLKRQLLAYHPSFSLQVSQVTWYPAYTAAYLAAGEWLKVILTVLFPVFKHCLKRLLRRVSDPTLEVTEETIVTGIEITAAIYQSMVMQSAPSVLVTIVTIGVDLIQGVLEVRHMMDKHSVIPQKDIVSSALTYIRRNGVIDTLTDDRLRAYASLRKSPLHAIQTSAVVPVFIDVRRATTADQQCDKTILVHALEILQAAETILLVEYLEVVVPLMNGVFLAFASQFEAAKYNTSIANFYFHHERLTPALLLLILYVALQSLSIVFMAYVMRVRFQISPSVLLAFHLERHAWSIQGKMVSWLSCLQQFSVLHYGADFTFQFQYRVPTPNQ